MKSLETRQIEDWGQFIEENDIDLSCDECNGTGEVEVEDGDEKEECQECSGGYVEPLWNTVWNTGFHASGREVPRQPAPNTLAFEYDERIWLGLTCCGMDCTPFLALAWINLFPDCRWIPIEFQVTGVNLRGGYLTSCLGEADAMRVLRVMETGIEGLGASLGQDLQDVRDAARKLAGRIAVGRKG